MGQHQRDDTTGTGIGERHEQTEDPGPDGVDGSPVEVDQA